MSEINNNLFEEKNKQRVLIDTDSMKSESNDIKLDFIKYVISETDIPFLFKPLVGSHSSNKIFYKDVDGEKLKREWLLFQNNTFFCAYCLCFSRSNVTNRLIKGIEHVKGCRITEKVKSHEDESHHKLAKLTYLNLVENTISSEGVQKRNVIKIIVKIIIYIATHGKNCDQVRSSRFVVVKFSCCFLSQYFSGFAFNYIGRYFAVFCHDTFFARVYFSLKYQL